MAELQPAVLAEDKPPSGDSPPPKPPFRPIPKWVMIVGVPLMIFIAVGGVWLLLGLGVTGDRLDAIRTGGTLGVGLGGAVVLWLAVRRQRSNELDLLQKYEAHRLTERVAAHNESVAADNRAHQQQVAQDARNDATERRITELYTKAVEQLGSDKAPVRLGGLYALERLAQNNTSQRQAIVNVFCAYLRMPYTSPGNDLLGDVDVGIRKDRERQIQERDVRISVQRILAAHLRPGKDSSRLADAFWPDINLDLTEATLLSVDFSQCRFGATIFDGAQFIGAARFDGTQFGEDMRCGEATFDQGATFDGAHFDGKAWFCGVRFDGNVGFGGVQFRGYVRFDKAKFAGKVYFQEARFCERVWFDEAQFGGKAWFGEEFNIDLMYDSAFFFKDVVFGILRLDVNAKDRYAGAKFEADASFLNANFDQLVDFYGVVFDAVAHFNAASFNADVSFRSTRFHKSVWFGRVQFRDVARFGGAQVAEQAYFEGVDISEGARIEDVEFATVPPGWPSAEKK